MALDDALIWISERYGRSLESLRWGDAHQAAHDHQVLGEVPLLRYFVNIRQSTSGGDNTLMRGRTQGGTGPTRSRMCTARAIAASMISPIPTAVCSSPPPASQVIS